MENAKPNNKNNCCSLAENQEKLKILALHGYRQNAEVFRQKTGAFRKLVHKWAQFVFITAPHKVIPIESLDKVDEINVDNCIETEEYGWWFNRDDRTFRGIRKGGPAIGFNESLQLIEETFEKHGPFDGILGFSQGACFVGLLCDLQQRGLTTCRFQFAILASGFKSGSLAHLKYYGDLIDLPILNIFGETDDIIPQEMSRDLGKIFCDVISVVHPGKHHLPGTSSQKEAYQKFFSKQFKRKNNKINFPLSNALMEP